MAMDRETRTLLKALVDGQVKLTERVDKLTEQVSRSVVLINALADGQAKLTERVDGFTAAVLRGFTDGAGRDHAIEKRVDVLESRVASLEQK